MCRKSTLGSIHVSGTQGHVYWTTPRLGQPIYLLLLLMDVLTQDVRKDVPGSMMFADDIALCCDDETDMIEYLETWRRALEDRGMRISRPKNKFMDFNLDQDNG